jgi:hypothetical protein
LASEKQIQANRINGLKGGVKTGEGKAITRFNAVSHGFFSKEILLTGEDIPLLAELRERYIAEFKPEGEFEALLVERIITGAWRLKRLIRSETRQSRIYSFKATEDSGSPAIVDYRSLDWQNLMRYEASLERQIYRAVSELRKHQKIRQGKADKDQFDIALDLADAAPGLNGLVNGHSQPG